MPERKHITEFYKRWPAHAEKLELIEKGFLEAKNSKIDYSSHPDWLSIPEEKRNEIVKWVKYSYEEMRDIKTSNRKIANKWNGHYLDKWAFRADLRDRSAKALINEFLNLNFEGDHNLLSLPDTVMEHVKGFQNGKRRDDFNTKLLQEMFSTKEEELPTVLNAYTDKFSNIINAARQEVLKNINITKPKHTIVGDMVRNVSPSFARKINAAGKSLGVSQRWI